MNATGRTPRTRRLSVKPVPLALIVILPALWLVIAMTLPGKDDRHLVIDVACSSGNPAVAIWVESRSGGSWFGEKGEHGIEKMRRFTFTQPWSGAYQVRVGCGGTTGDWGITAQSTYRDESYRKLECDDADPTSADAPSCADLFD